MYGRLFHTLILIFTIAVAIYVATATAILGLSFLSEPYILSPIVSVLGVNGSYLVSLGSERNSEKLKYCGGLLLTIGFTLLSILIFKALDIL